MPFDDPDFEDPQELVGVSLPGDEATTREMARAFAEEFLQLGFSEYRVLAIFRDRRYVGPHQAFSALGPAVIEQVVRAAAARWGVFRVRTEDAQAPPVRGRRRLRVLDPGGR
jgi:hypothetical protein